MKTPLILFVSWFCFCANAKVEITDQVGAQSYSKGLSHGSYHKRFYEKYDNRGLDGNYEYSHEYRNEDKLGVKDNFNGKRSKDLYGDEESDLNDERKKEDFLEKQTVSYYGKIYEDDNDYEKKDRDLSAKKEYSFDNEEYTYGKNSGEDIYSRREFEGYGKKIGSQEYYNDKEFYLKHGVYVGNPDDFSKYELPCQNYDIYCIRKYFADHAKCKIARGPVPDPLYRAQTSFYTPNANLSVILTNVQISGLNGRVTAFYLNKVTNNLVMATEFKAVTVTAEVTLEFFRNAQEPVVTNTPTIFTFPSMEITTVIPNKDDLQLEKSENVAYNMAPPVFTVSPSALVDPSPQPAISFSEALINVQTSVQEYLFTDAVFFASSYIQYNICDFKLKVF